MVSTGMASRESSITRAAVRAAVRAAGTLPSVCSDAGASRVGDHADVMVYNMDELGLLYDKPKFANDFPGGEKRLVQYPTGMRYILVNGNVTFQENECTGALPGKLLRSYDQIG